MKFEKNYIIDYKSIDHKFTATLPGLMYFIQETTIRHGDSTKYGTKWFLDNRLAWLLSNWRIKVLKYPEFNESITVKTYPIFFKGAVGERGFEMYSQNGEPLLYAVSSWVFADLVKSKPIRPEPDMLANYGQTYPEPFDKGNFMPHINDLEFELSSKRIFTATRRDTDPNRHVNNVMYIEWAFDNIPDEIYNFCRATKVNAIYKKECKPNDAVLCEFYTGVSDPFINYCIFRKADDYPVVYAEIHMVWDKY